LLQLSQRQVKENTRTDHDESTLLDTDRGTDKSSTSQWFTLRRGHYQDAHGDKQFLRRENTHTR